MQCLSQIEPMQDYSLMTSYKPKETSFEGCRNSYNDQSMVTHSPLSNITPQMRSNIMSNQQLKAQKSGRPLEKEGSLSHPSQANLQPQKNEDYYIYKLECQNIAKSLAQEKKLVEELKADLALEKEKVEQVTMDMKMLLESKELLQEQLTEQEKMCTEKSVENRLLI